MQPSTARARGFTLLETLTVLAVLAVLTAIAIPSWRTHVLRVRRSDASVALIQLQKAEDDYFARNARYAAGAQLTEAPPRGLGQREYSQQGMYRLSIRADADGLGYLATAVVEASAAQAPDDHCTQFSLDHNGQRHAQDSSGADRSADCWR